MKSGTKEILVYADWAGLGECRLVGVLHSNFVRGKEIFSFEYDKKWLQSEQTFSIDPDLQLFSGVQYLRDEKSNFGVFLDSSPDRWGRLLMERREN
jgi:serine/threonine-protein kinase HipA